MAGHADEILDFLEVVRRDVVDRVLLPIDRALLQCEVDLLERDWDRSGTHRCGVHQELRRMREPHPKPLQVRWCADRLVRGELSSPGGPGARTRTPVAVRNPSLSGCEASDVKKRWRWSESSKTKAPSTTLIGGVQRAQCGSTLDVHVDVASHDGRDPVGVATELAGAGDGDRRADVRRRDLVGDDLGAAGVLWLRILVAMRQGELDSGLRRGRRRRSAPGSHRRGLGGRRRRAAGARTAAGDQVGLPPARP